MSDLIIDPDHEEKLRTLFLSIPEFETVLKSLQKNELCNSDDFASKINYSILESKGCILFRQNNQSYVKYYLNFFENLLTKFPSFLPILYEFGIIFSEKENFQLADLIFNLYNEKIEESLFQKSNISRDEYQNSLFLADLKDCSKIDEQDFDFPEESELELNDIFSLNEEADFTDYDSDQRSALEQFHHDNEGNYCENGFFDSVQYEMDHDDEFREWQEGREERDNQIWYEKQHLCEINYLEGPLIAEKLIEIETDSVLSLIPKENIVSSNEENKNFNILIKIVNGWENYRADYGNLDEENYCIFDNSYQDEIDLSDLDTIFCPICERDDFFDFNL